MIKAKDIDESITWQTMTMGAAIYEAGTSFQVKTGDWATQIPMWKKDACTQCLLCVPVCPDIAIVMQPDQTRGEVDYEHCKGCGICMKQCPFHAITMIPKEVHHE